MSDDDFGGMAVEIKKIIAENIPQEVKLIVYTHSTNKNYYMRQVPKL